jgi:hypothetical protein
VARLWIVAKVAETFHVLPSVAARDLDEDPNQTAIECLALLNYARGKHVFDAAKGDDKKIESMGVSEDLAADVRLNTFISLKERREHGAHGDQKVAGCRYCGR